MVNKTTVTIPAHHPLASRGAVELSVRFPQGFLPPEALKALVAGVPLRLEVRNARSTRPPDVTWRYGEAEVEVTITTDEFAVEPEGNEPETENGICSFCHEPTRRWRNRQPRGWWHIGESCPGVGQGVAGFIPTRRE